MRNQTPLAPNEPTFDVTVYIVLNDFGPLGRACVETDEAEADEDTIIENILSGQYSHPLRIVAFNTVEGWARTWQRTLRMPCRARRRVNTAQLGRPYRSFWYGRSE